MLVLLLACTGAPADDKPADTGTPDTDTDTTGDTDTGPFTLSVTAATPSDGHPLAAECGFELSVDYECYNPSPALVWDNAPDGTVAFALVFDDPDAGGFDHWAVVNLPADATGLDAGVSGQGVDGTLPGDAYELENGFGFPGYLGSCPPEAHVYRWRLWALSEPLEAGVDRFAQVENQAEARALGMAETCHIYGPASE